METNIKANEITLIISYPEYKIFHYPLIIHCKLDYLDKKK